MDKVGIDTNGTHSNIFCCHECPGANLEASYLMSSVKSSIRCQTTQKIEEAQDKEEVWGGQEERREGKLRSGYKIHEKNN